MWRYIYKCLSYCDTPKVKLWWTCKETCCNVFSKFYFFLFILLERDRNTCNYWFTPQTPRAGRAGFDESRGLYSIQVSQVGGKDSCTWATSKKLGQKQRAKIQSTALIQRTRITKHILTGMPNSCSWAHIFFSFWYHSVMGKSVRDLNQVQQRKTASFVRAVTWMSQYPSLSFVILSKHVFAKMLNIKVTYLEK